MCGRYTVKSSARDIAEVFGTDVPEEFYERFNVAPSQLVPVIANDDPGHVGMFKWGLIPSWAKDEKIGYKMINARAETLAEKPSFRTALNKRRCLIIADGFYEWKTVGKVKHPYYIQLADRQPFAFAGLWEVWHNPAGEAVKSCTIITTTPNSLMERFHDRMPVIFDQTDDFDAWLGEGDGKAVGSLLKPFPASEMEAWEVGAAVGNPRNQGPELAVPV